MEEEETVNKLEFKLSPRTLDQGSREEKTTFGQFSVEVNDVVASEGVTFGSNELLLGPYAPAYHVADWLVRNWWRLAYEPLLNDDLENTTMDWDLAHWMSSIGEGYVWPNILLVSDGLRVTVKTVASQDSDGRAFRYLGPDKTHVITLDRYQQAVRSFVTEVLELARDGSNVVRTDLEDHWEKLQDQIDSKEESTWCRLEAMLGFDPGEADRKSIHQSIEDMKTLGNEAVAELAADANTRQNSISSASDIANAAKKVGFNGRIDDGIDIQLRDNIHSWGESDAWRIGVATAHAVRQSEGLNGQPIDDTRLANMAGTSKNVISAKSRSTDKLSFLMADDSGKFRIAMRSRRETGRRFDVARLIADRLFDNGIDDPLSPATQAYTYRQKAQRAFAAELLAPYDALEDFLNGDRTEDRCTEAAEYFDVSTDLINASIQNNLRLH